MQKKAFTIVELLVAMGLLAVMMAVSAMVFAYAVRAQRAAAATSEIMSRVQALTQQLSGDLNGLRKDGEFLIVWQPAEQVDSKGAIVPNEYISLDRLFLFSSGNAQTFNEQETTTVNVFKRISSNLSRVCYSFDNKFLVNKLPDPVVENRLFCRVRHLVTADAEMPAFPNVAGWNPVTFASDEYKLEYQTMSINEWWNIPNLPGTPTKDEILSIVLNAGVGSSSIKNGGPNINLSDSKTLHNLFSQGIGQFHVQIWRADLNRWFPEFDPNGDGNFGDSDYLTNGALIATANNIKPAELTLRGMKNKSGDVDHLYYVSENPSIELPFTQALKFTFTVYDSNGFFKDGKTFTHIVYLN